MSDNDETQSPDVETTGDDSAQLVASTSTSATCLPKTIWDGRSIITVKDVYNKNLVEDENKDTIMAVGNVMSQTIFPKMKFLVNWDSCCVPYHDKEKDENYLQTIFERMGWNYRSNEQLHVQAIKWNTYRLVGAKIVWVFPRVFFRRVNPHESVPVIFFIGYSQLGLYPMIFN